jgi:hypothetical protein
MQMDTNHDGKISFEEFFTFHLEHLELNTVSDSNDCQILVDDHFEVHGNLSECTAEGPVEMIELKKDVTHVPE